MLAEVGAGFPDVVRVDQYYTTVRAMHPYHEVRHEVFKGVIPPSTSNLHQRFARTGQTIELQVMAAVPGAGLTVKHETFTPSYKISPVSGYSPALSVGDFRFVPGQTGEARKEATARSIRKCAIRAHSGDNGRSSSKPNFIITTQAQGLARRRRREPRRVVKAQVYLSDREDVPGFNEVWLSHFKTPPGDHDHRDGVARLLPSRTCASRSTRSRSRLRARPSAR